MTLYEGKCNTWYRVKEIRTGEELARRLQVLGLTIGTKVELLHRKKKGALIFQVRGTRFAVGKEIAANIVVEEAS